MVRVKILVLILSAMFFSNIVVADPLTGGVDPSLQWQTLKTKHFNIHFHKQEKQTALRFANIAEDTHLRLSKVFKWEPEAPTEVLLNDALDQINGFAKPSPFNKVHINTFAPLHPSILADYDDYLKFVFTHEYTHVLHIDKAPDACLSFRHLLGRHPFFFPNILQPLWLVEGLATHSETDYKNKIGRGQSSSYQMFMRMEVLRGLQSLDQINLGTSITWPIDVQYLYGYHFFEFVEKTYGKETILKMVDDYSDNIIPYLVNATSKSVFNKDISALWQEYQEYLKQKFEPQLKDIKATRIVEGVSIANQGGRIGNVKALANGTVYFTTSGLGEPNYLLKRLPNGKVQKLARFKQLVSDLPFDVHPESGIVFSKVDYHKKYYLYSDLYLLDINTNKIKQLTTGKRFHHATWHPDGNSIAATQFENDTWKLVLLNKKGEIIDTLWAGEENEQISQIDWSSNQSKIVAAIHRAKKGWQLAEFDLKRRTWDVLVSNNSIIADPQYSKDGKYVYFSSDEDKLFNIRKIDLATKKITTLTNVLGGAFKPAEGASPNELYYYQYKPNGYNLFKLEKAQKQLGYIAHKKQKFVQSLVGSDKQKAKDTDYTIESYSPWPTLAKFILVPTIGNSVGVDLTGEDALSQHSYKTHILYDFKEKDVEGSFQYTYNDRLTIGGSFENNKLTILGNGGPNWNKAAYVQYQFPLVKALENQLYFATRLTHYIDNNRCSVGGALVFNNAVMYHNSFSPSFGRNISLSAQHFHTNRSVTEGQVYKLDWEEYIPINNKNVIKIGFIRTWTNKEVVPFILGNYDNRGSDLFGQQRYDLRGYSSRGNRIIGKQAQIANVEWRFLIAKLRWGFDKWPFGTHQLSGTLFAEAGSAWDDKSAFPRHYLPSVGAELHLDAMILYNAPVRFSIGYAKGLDRAGQDQFSFFLKAGMGF